MKGMPLAFEIERKRVVVPCAKKVVHFKDFVINKQKLKYIEQEPKSVLDIVNSSPSPPTSTSTSTVNGGGGLTAVSGDQFTKWSMPENQETCSSNVGFFDPHQRLPEKCLDITVGEEKCGEMEDWESVLSESGQGQSILRWAMGDVDDPSMGLHKMLHGGGTVDSGELSGEFGIVDQGCFGFDSNNPVGQFGNFFQIPHKFTHEKIGLSQSPAPETAPAADMVTDHCHRTSDLENPFAQNHQIDVKPYKDPTFFGHVEHQTLVPSQPNRYNSGSIEYNMSQMPKTPFLGTPQNTIQMPLSIKKMSGIDEIGHQGIIDQLYKAAEMIQCGNNPILAQSILARLNHQLSPIGKPPFERAAFYFKEALMLLIHSLVNNMNPVSSPFSLIFKIGAYKSFSEVSPLVQFTNFTCNQAILESLDGFEHVHIIDFDIGYGDQWASFMQELALRSNNNNIPSLKITAFASHSNDHLELSLTRDNLVHFANDLKIGFDFEIVNIDVVASVSWSLPVRASNKEAIAVNLPVNVFSNYQVLFSLVLRFVKNLSPKIVVSVDRGCDRTDLPFPNHLIHALQSFTNLLESLDAVNMNLETSQKIERFLIQPSVEKITTGRFSFPEKTQHWRSQLLSSGFSPLIFSNFTESQAVCVIKRIPVQGFHIERRQSSLVLCWQNRELVSASAWRC
uniref:scarecrow-like protein 6 n=1 Tax=Erigeron canadensis TaxID=72917 RepID=UPI001CB8CA6B|nr:scarecrow-like protein 6 [Erigeron canadensis]